MKRIIVKSFLQDAKNTGSIPSVRSKMIEEASSKSVASDFRANALAKTLHPEYFPVRLKKAEAVNGFMCAEIVRCDSDEPFYFKGGQYLGIRYSLEGKEFFSAVPTLGL